MRVPRQLEVGPFVYAVKTDALAVAGLAGDLGECNPDRATIVLDPKQPATIARESLMHEAIHAVLSVSGIAAEIGEQVEEAYARRLAPVLLDLLRRNPAVVAYWCEKEKP